MNLFIYGVFTGAFFMTLCFVTIIGIDLKKMEVSDDKTGKQHGA